MNFYDALIDEVMQELTPYPARSFPVGTISAWKDVGHNELVLQKEAAFELEGVGFNLVTSGNLGTGIDRDIITVIGDDLTEIHSSRPFARICLIQLKEPPGAGQEVPSASALPVRGGNRDYDRIKRLEYARYHCFPQGYMMRTSTKGYREAVRVSRSAIREGITFPRTGSLLLEKLHETGLVARAQMLFLTDPAIDYRRFERTAARAGEITRTLDHVMRAAITDCHSCAMKPICDEVDGMRELHFAGSGRM